MTLDPVQINTCFELVGSALALDNVRQARKVRPAGVSVPAVGWSCLWALETISYYLSHNETLAACCAALRSACALVWVCLALRPAAQKSV